MDFKEVVESAPVPILVYQDGRVVYGNPATYHFCRLMGLVVSDGRIHEVDLMCLAPEVDHAEIAGDVRGILEDGKVLHNVPRTLCTAGGSAVSTLFSACPVTWRERPAIEVSLVVVGFPPMLLEPEKRTERFGLGVTPDARTALLGALGPRESQVALLVAEGNTNAAIGARLGIRPSTLKGYLKSIYRKLGVHSRSDLVLRVIGHR